MWYLVGIHPALRRNVIASPTAHRTGRSPAPESRLQHLDTLRTFLTGLVIVHHSAIIYGAEGLWDYVETPRRSVPLTMFCGVNQTWFMGAFFLITGYLSASSLERSLASAHRTGQSRGIVISKFMKGRLLRIGLPAVVYTLVEHPLVLNLAGKLPLTWPAYQYYVTSLRGVKGTAWWLATAVTFDAIQAAYSSLNFRERRVSRYTPPLALAGLPIFGFFWRYVCPLGSHIQPLSLHGAYAPQYVLAYFTGVWLQSEPQLLASGSLPSKQTWHASPAPAVGLWLAYCAFILSWPVTRDVARDPSPLFEGGNIQTLAYTIWQELGFAALTHAALRIAELLTDSNRPQKRGPRTLPRLAYGAFLVHPLVLTAIAVQLRGVELRPVAKTLVVGSMSTVASFAVSAVLTKLPWVRNVV